MKRSADIICIGSVLWDIIGRAPSAMRLGADVPGRIVRLPGGVALNIALTLARFGMVPTVLTALGRDPEGDELVAACTRLGVQTHHAYRSDDLPTDRYMAIEGAGGLVAAVADAHSLEAAGDKILRPLEDGRLGSRERPWHGPVALDGNLTQDLLTDIARSPLFRTADLRAVPASPGKAERLRPLLLREATTLYVNLEESRTLGHEDFPDAPTAAARLSARSAARIIVTDGGRIAADGVAGIVVAGKPPPVPVGRVTGAGDTFMAAHLMAEQRGASRSAALTAALRAAADYVSGEIGA